MLVYIPSTGEKTILENDDAVIIYDEKNGFIPMVRVFRGKTQLLIGVGAEKRLDYSVFLQGSDQEKWSPLNIGKTLKISGGELKSLPSDNPAVHNYVFIKNKEN